MFDSFARKNNTETIKYSKEDYDLMQLEEIDKGRTDGLDVSLYENPEFIFLQMREIRIGLQNKIDASVYADKDYDWFQMSELRKGLEDKLDVSIYANKNLDYLIMREIRLGLKSNVNLMPYVRKGFSTSIIRQVRIGREHDINLEKYVLDGYESDQLEQIYRGLKFGVDVDKYCNQEYSGGQMKEIRLGLEAEVDINMFKDIKFNWKQMREIRLGLENQVDVLYYQDTNYSARQMYEIRYGLMEGKDVSAFSKYMYSASEMYKIGQSIPSSGDIDVSYIIDSNHEVFDTGIDGMLDSVKKDNGKSNQLIQIVVAHDDMSATIKINTDELDMTLEKDLILDAIKETGIKYGLDNSAIDSLLEDKMYNQKVVIARGKPIVEGTDGYFDYNFKTKMPIVPKILENGAVDYKNIDFFQTVLAGEVLCRYVPGKSGLYGCTVKGKLVAPRRVVEQPRLIVSGVDVEDDVYTAQIDGRIEFTGSELNVSPIYVYNGDVTSSVGNIKFLGDIVVKGFVGSGVTIEADGSVVIDGNVEGAFIKAGKSILVRAGISAGGKGSVNCKGDIFAKFIEDANVFAGGKIESNYILNSSCAALEKIIVSGNKGRITGGKSYAIKGIEAWTIGNTAETKSYFEIGRNTYYKKVLLNYNEKHDELINEQQVLKRLLLKYGAIYNKEELNTLSIYQKVKMELLEIDKKLNEVEADKEAYKNSFSGLRRPISVAVAGIAYPGCKIRVDDSVFLVTEKTPRVMYQLEKGNVGQFNYYLNK